MKNVYHKNIVLDVPECWEEVSFQNYIKATKNIDSDMMFIANLMGLSMSYLISNLTQGKIREILDIMEFVKTPPNPETIISFTHKGKVYALHGSLPEMSFAQAIDIDTLTTGKEDMECITYILAVLFFQVEETHYDEVIPHVMKRAKEFLQLPCTVVLGIHNFFLLICHLSEANFRKFLETAKQKVQQMETQAIAYSKSTDGEVFSMNSSALTSLSSMKLEIESLLKY